MRPDFRISKPIIYQWRKSFEKSILKHFLIFQLNRTIWLLVMIKRIHILNKFGIVIMESALKMFYIIDSKYSTPKITVQLTILLFATTNILRLIDVHIFLSYREVEYWASCWRIYNSPNISRNFILHTMYFMHACLL